MSCVRGSTSCRVQAGWLTRCSQIASHLHPLDILQLSRVSNELRAMLLSRNSRHIWTAARKNMDPPFPDIVVTISEPKLAHLLFEHICSVSTSSIIMLEPAISRPFCRAWCDRPACTGLHSCATYLRERSPARDDRHRFARLFSTRFGTYVVYEDDIRANHPIHLHCTLSLLSFCLCLDRRYCLCISGGKTTPILHITDHRSRAGVRSWPFTIH